MDKNTYEKIMKQLAKAEKHFILAVDWCAQAQYTMRSR